MLYRNNILGCVPLLAIVNNSLKDFPIILSFVLSNPLLASPNMTVWSPKSKIASYKYLESIGVTSVVGNI